MNKKASETLKPLRLALPSDYSSADRPNYLVIDKTEKDIFFNSIFYDDESLDIRFALDGTRYSPEFKESMHKFFKSSLKEAETNSNIESNENRIQVFDQDSLDEIPNSLVMSVGLGDGDISACVFKYSKKSEHVRIELQESKNTLEFINAINKFIKSAQKELQNNSKLQEFSK